MPKVAARPRVIVDAWQFTGTPESAAEILAACHADLVEASRTSEYEWKTKLSLPRLVIHIVSEPEMGPQPETVSVGDFVTRTPGIREGDNPKYDIISAERFHATYETL